MSDDKKNKIGDKKIGRVDITKQTSDIEKTGAVKTIKTDNA